MKRIFRSLSILIFMIICFAFSDNNKSNCKICLNGKWIEFIDVYIDRKDSLIDKEYIKSSYLKEILQQGNDAGNIKKFEMFFKNDSTIIETLYYLSNFKPSSSIANYKFINENTLQWKSINNKIIKTDIVHILYCSKMYIILGYENKDEISMYKRQDNKDIDDNLNINDEFFILPFIKEYIKLKELNINIE